MHLRYYMFFRLNKQIILFLYCLTQFSIAQNVPDFVISTHGLNPRFDLDNENNMHVVFDSINLDSYIKYTVFDSLGRNIRPSIPITRNLSGETPIIKIKGKYAAIAWTELSLTFNSYVFCKVIDISNDTIVNNDILINDSYGDTYRYNPDITFINDSTFVVVWFGGGTESPDMGIYGQIINSSLSKISNNFLISDHGGIGISYGEVKVLDIPSIDNFLVIWRDNHTGTEKIYGRFFYETGIPKDVSFLISEDQDIDDIFYLNCAADTAGNFAVIWGAEKDSVWEIQWRWFDKDGEPFGPTEIITANDINTYPTVDIAIDTDGKGIVIYEKLIDGYLELYFQRFTSKREFLGTELNLSAFPEKGFQVFPNTLIKNGKIFSIWQDLTNGNRFTFGNIIDFYNPPVSVRGNSLSDIFFDKSSFNLLGNYPNPFNPITIITYNLPEEGFVSLKVYDILGNEVADLINDVRSAGSYNAEFNASNLASGVYIYRILVRAASGGFISSKKMILAK